METIIYNFKTPNQNCFSHFQCLLSIHQIAQLQSILCIDCNSNTKTLSILDSTVVL